MEDQAQWKLGNQPALHPLEPMRSCPGTLRDNPSNSKDSPEQQTQQSSVESEERPHKFQPGPDWTMVSRKWCWCWRNALPYCTLVEDDNLDKELGKEKVNDVLGN